MDNFIQAFTDGFEEDDSQISRDESPASRVNVVLRSARRFVQSPDSERRHFQAELEAFEAGLQEATEALESLFDQANETEQIFLEQAHRDLEVLSDHLSGLEQLLENPDASTLDSIREEALIPTYRLLLGKAALESLANQYACPFCEAEVSRDSARCEKCGKPLKVADPLKQEGEFIAVPQSISTFLQTCFRAAQSPEEHLAPWQQQLNQLRQQFKAALKRVEQALRNEKPESPTFGEFTEMKQGIEHMLAGFNELETYRDSLNPEVLDTGWVNMMRGYKIFKEAGDRLAVLTAPR